jgi:hypothetical protein
VCTILFLLLVVAGLQAAIAAVEAQGPTVTVSIDSLSLRVGEEGSVDLQVVGYPEPGLGAWTIDTSYDPQIVSVTRCDATGNAICEPQYSETTVRITGAEVKGLVGNFALGTIRFRCQSAGGSPLTLTPEVFGPAIGFPPQPEVMDGTIACEEPVEPTATGVASSSATPAPQLPATGTGGSDSSNDLKWVVAGLGAVAVVASAFAVLHLAAPTAEGMRKRKSRDGEYER